MIMTAKNSNPAKHNKTNNEDPAKTGLDEWNERLDNNLEPNGIADQLADERARIFSELNGSGDQSDENIQNNP
jgi:hypothetical protein